jgi:hypothetical protein
MPRRRGIVFSVSLPSNNPAIDLRFLGGEVIYAGNDVEFLQRRRAAADSSIEGGATLARSLTQCRLQELCFVGNEEDVRSRSHGGTCAHYKSANNVRASRRSLVSKPSLNQPRSGTTSMSSAPGATRSPSSRQQLVEQKKPGSRPGFSFIGACPDRGLRHRPVRRHRAVRR